VIILTVVHQSINKVNNTCDGRRSTGELDHQFIMLSVHLYLQRDAGEVERRAGPSATAETCPQWCVLVRLLVDRWDKTYTRGLCCMSIAAIFDRRR